MKKLVNLLTRINSKEDVIPHLVDNHYEKVMLLNDIEKKKNKKNQYQCKHPLDDRVLILCTDSMEETSHSVTPNPSWNTSPVNITVRDTEENNQSEVKLELEGSKKESEMHETRFITDEEIRGDQ